MSKRSMPSLVAGVGESVANAGATRLARHSAAAATFPRPRFQCLAAFGAVYAASGYLINNGRDEYGHIVGAVASAALVGVMGPKYMKTRAAFPPGVLAVSGAVVGSYDTYKGVQVWRNLLEE